MRIRVGQIKNAERLVTTDVKQTRLRIKARSRPVRRPPRGWRDEHARNDRLLLRIADWLAFCIESFCPIQGFDKWSRNQVLAVGSIKQEEVPVPACLCQHLAWPAMEFPVNQ